MGWQPLLRRILDLQLLGTPDSEAIYLRASQKQTGAHLKTPAVYSELLLYENPRCHPGFHEVRDGSNHEQIL